MKNKNSNNQQGKIDKYVKVLNYLIVILAIALIYYIWQISQENQQAAPVTQAKAASSPAQLNDYVKQLVDIMASHPEKDIRETMLNAWRANQFSIVVQFEYYSNHMATIILKENVQGVYIPTLYFYNIVGFLNLDKKLQSLTIWHEYWHLDQYFTGRIPVRNFVQKPDGYIHQAEEAAYIFKSELEAYEKECQLALKLGVLEGRDMFSIYAKSTNRHNDLKKIIAKKILSWSNLTFTDEARQKIAQLGGLSD